MSISDIVRPRSEVRDGEFQGVLQAHKVGAESDRLENDPDRLLSMTYPSNALETAIGFVEDKLAGDDNQGGITINGPYGSGKSHALLALYHLFQDPVAGQSWVDEWDLGLDVPETAEATVLSTSQTDADRVWEPILQDLGADDILEDINHYPTVDHLESLAADEPVAIFFDEIETWWGSLNHDEESELVEQNEFFLQNLLEVAEDPESDLFVFITLLDKNEDIKRILNRTSPYGVDLNDSGDRERVILHRLFETPREEIDESEVRDVVERYIEGYTAPVELPEQKRYEQRMVDTYPFHPNLLDLLDDLYEAAEGRQNTRGAMGVLADTLERVHDETDLVITADIEPRPFRGFSQVLYDRYISDCDEVADIPYGEDLLQTILLYTVNDRAQEASVNECLLGTFKPDENSISRLDMSLRELYGTAHYLDRDSEDGPYYLAEDPRLSALVTREQDRIFNDSRDAVEDKLAEIIRDDVWSGGSEVYIYGRNDVPDSSSISVVITLDYLSNGALNDALSDFFADRTYGNTVLFVTPSKEVRGDEAILRKTARVLGAENLRGKVDDEGDELGRIIRDERRELTNELANRYGKWVKWSEDHQGDLRMRRISVGANVADVKSEVGHDKRYIGEKIEDEVEGVQNGIRVGSMLNDFKQFRRMPVVLEDSTFYSAVRQLHRDEKIVIEGDRSNYYVASKNDYPPEITDEQTIYDPEVLPDYIFEEEEDEEDTDNEGEDESGDSESTSESETTTPGATKTSGDEGGGTSTVTSTTTVTTLDIDLEGNGSRVLRSQAESRLNGKSDRVTSVDIDYNGDALTKAELIDLIESLPEADRINVDLTVERDDED